MPSGKKLQPWHRKQGEGFRAFELFMTYLSLGADRSIQLVAEKSGRSLSLCNELSAKFKWVSRATAYDDWMISVQETAIQNSLAKDAIVFAQRRSLYRETEYTLAQQLIDIGLQMVQAPLYETIVTKLENIKTLEHPEGQEIAVAVTMIPAKWTKRDGVAYLKVASEIMRLSLQMETSRPTVTVNLEDPKVRFQMAQQSYNQWKKDIGKLVDEQMEVTPWADRAAVTSAILQKLPEWAAADWKLKPEEIPLLTEGDDVLPLEGTIEGVH